MSSIDLAATYVQDALRGFSTERKTDALSLYLYTLYNSQMYKACLYVVIVINLALALEEYPSRFHSIDRDVLRVVEFLTWLVFASDIAIYCSYTPRKVAFADYWVLSKLVVLAATLVECIVSAYLPHSPRFIRLMRPLFMIDKEMYLRKLFASIMFALPRIMGIFVLILLQISIFALVGHILFHHLSDMPVDEEESLPCSTYLPTAQHRCDDYFTSMETASLQLFILLTTANFPDVMLPAYRKTRWSAVFFVLFILLGIYCLLNVVLVTAYNNYRLFTKQLFLKRETARHEAVQRAFQTLTSDYEGLGRRDSDLASGGALSLEQWQLLMANLRPDLEKEVVLVLFDAIDTSRSRYLQLSEFEELVELVNIKARKCREDPRAAAVRWNKRSKLIRNLRNVLRPIVLHPRTDDAVDFLVFVNVVLLLWSLAIRDSNDPLLYVNDALLYLFVLELSAKILVIGWEPFSRKFLNRLDVIIVGMGIFHATLDFVSFDDLSLSGGTLSTILRMSRLFRSFRLLRSFKLILKTLSQLVQPLLRFAGLLFALFYAYSIIGMECFAGKLTLDNPAVNASSYGALQYQRLNFDDQPTAFVALWYLLIVNNWPVLMEGCEAATNSWARLYFISFYIVAVSVLCNVLVAFLLDLFMVKYHENNLKLKGQKEKWLVLVEDAAKDRGIDGRYLYSRPIGIGDVFSAIFRADIPLEIATRTDLRQLHTGEVSAEHLFQQRRKFRQASMDSSNTGTATGVSPAPNHAGTAAAAAAVAAAAQSRDGRRSSSAWLSQARRGSAKSVTSTDSLMQTMPIPQLPRLAPAANDEGAVSASMRDSWLQSVNDSFLRERASSLGN